MTKLLGIDGFKVSDGDLSEGDRVGRCVDNPLLDCLVVEKYEALQLFSLSSLRLVFLDHIL